MTTLLCQRLNIPADWMDLKWHEGVISSSQLSVLKNPLHDGYKQAMVSNVVFGCTINYYADEHWVVKKLAGILLDSFSDYLLGEWQDLAASGERQDEPPSRAWWRGNLNWKLGWDGCLAFGSALGEWDKLIRIASFFTDGVGGNLGQTDANYCWDLIVAGVLTDRPDDELAIYREKIAAGTGRDKREQLLLAFLDAIRNGSDQELASTSSEYFKHYLKTDAKKKEVLAPLMFDGSFLVHFAKRAGRTVPIPENIQDHLIAL